MDETEREKLYREAMAARRAGDTCPLCGEYHSALSACRVEARTARAVGTPLARNTDPESSKINARAVRAEKIIDVCLRHYAEHPEGLVHDDLGHLSRDGGHESYRRRGSQLKELGWIRVLKDAQGDPVRRRTQSHRGVADVYVITAAGRQEIARRDGMMPS